MFVNKPQSSNETQLAPSARPAGVSHIAPDRDLAYYAALKLVARIEEELARGTPHYHDKAGRLLTRLDEVVRAILANDLSEEA